MRCSGRNLQLVHYALYNGVSSVTDEYGNEIGQEVSYGSPKPLYVNISAARNAEFADVFGLNIDYDRVMVIPTRNFEIDEQSVLWVDTDSESGPFDYIVRRVSKSINQTAIAIKRVDVLYGNTSSESNSNTEQHPEPDNGTGSVLPESGAQSSDTP